MRKAQKVTKAIQIKISSKYKSESQILINALIEQHN